MVAEGRKYLYQELKKLGVACVETATNFILADLKKNTRSVYERLLRKGVIVRPMGAWGLNTFLRVTIGTPQDNQRFIQALKESMK